MRRVWGRASNWHLAGRFSGRSLGGAQLILDVYLGTPQTHGALPSSSAVRDGNTLACRMIEGGGKESKLASFLIERVFGTRRTPPCHISIATDGGGGVSIEQWRSWRELVNQLGPR